MIAGIRLGELRKPSGGLPVEGAAVYDDAAQGGAVSADKFGSRVNHNIRAMLNGPDQIGGAEGVIDDQGNLMLMGELGQRLDVRDIGVRIPQSFQINRLGFRADSLFHLVQIMDVHEGGIHAEGLQGSVQQVVGAAVNGILGNDMSPDLATASIA